MRAGLSKVILERLQLIASAFAPELLSHHLEEFSGCVTESFDVVIPAVEVVVVSADDGCWRVFRVGRAIR